MVVTQGPHVVNSLAFWSSGTTSIIYDINSFYVPSPSLLFLTSPLLHSSLPLYTLLPCPSFTPSPLLSFLSPSFPSLLFPSHPELVRHLFSISGVPDTLRAQQLSMEQIGQLCTAYHKLVARTELHDTP